MGKVQQLGNSGVENTIFKGTTSYKEYYEILYNLLFRLGYRTIPDTEEVEYYYEEGLNIIQAATSIEKYWLEDED